MSEAVDEEALFHAAVARAAGERAAFLDRECAGDAALRARLEALLAAHDRPDTAGSPGCVVPRIGFESETMSGSEPDDMVGRTIGRYRLLERLGEGGCGMVLVAEQCEPVRRRVALKLIKPGMDSKAVIARFEAERQALARMDHPGIAKVFDAGTTDGGRPYFVMELVHGFRITEYCDRERLGLRDRLLLFIKVCQAIQHAHQKGIIHRDIKPSNILVALHDGVPTPKVIDFGIAKATEGRLTDSTVCTQLHPFIGTPAYMSPEQAEMSGLDIDTRSDIYSLGVLLYELLTGVTPFDARELMAQGLDAMRRTIREREPARPSTRFGRRRTVRSETPFSLGHPVLPSDLDWIVMRCLEKDRGRRYETANGLAADLKRHLANEPVVARPPSSGYRLRKAIQRNRVAFGAGVAVAATLVVASASSLRQMKRANRSAQDAMRHAAEADRARENAEAVVGFLTNVFSRPDPDRDGRAVTVAETLDRAALRLDADLLDQPERRALLQSTLADTYRALGLYREAVPLLEKVLDYQRGAAGPTDAASLAVAIRLAESYGYAGRHADAMPLKEEVLAHRSRTLGPDHPDTLVAMDQLAVSCEEVGQFEKALDLYRQSVDLHRKVNGPAHRHTLAAMRRLAFSLGGAGRPEEALRQLETLLPLVRRSLGPTDRETLWVMAELAAAHAARSQHARALEYRRQVVDLSRETLGPEHPDTLHAMFRLADSLAATGQAGAALELRETIVASNRRILGTEHHYTLFSMAALATSYHQASGRLDDAIRLMEEVLELRRRVNGSEHRYTLLVMHLLASYYHDAGRAAEALRLGQEAVAGRRRVVGVDDPDTLWSLANLAEYLDRAGRRSEALEALEEVYARRRQVLGLSHVDTLFAMERLGRAYRAADRNTDAERLDAEHVRARAEKEIPGALGVAAGNRPSG